MCSFFCLCLFHTSIIDNCETRTKYGARPSYSPYFGSPGTKEAQFVKITAPGTREAQFLKRTPPGAREVYTVKKTGEGQTVGSKNWESAKSKTCTFRRQSRL